MRWPSPASTNGVMARHRDRPRRGIKQRQFAEVRAGGELADFATPADDGRLPFEDDEERFTLLALAHDVRTLRRLDDVDVAGDDSQVAGRAPGEQRNGTETLDGGGA